MSDKKTTPLWQKLALILGGTAFAFGAVLLALLLFPGLVPSPVERSEAGTTLEVRFTYLDGDTFVLQRGRVRPPEENVLLGQYVLAWDENGFRVPAMTAEHYPIAAFGDSFTEAPTVPAPWTDRLAARLDTPVQNFGYRGYGPLESAAVAQEFLTPPERDWVLYAHFSGNDLVNANRAALRDDVFVRSPLVQLDWLLRYAGESAENYAPDMRDDDNYDYPMPVIIGSSYYDMAFYEELLWWQVAPEGGFLGTETFNVIGESLDRIAAAAEGACHAVVFVPSKEQLYYPYIHPNSQRYFNTAFHRLVVDRNNYIRLEGAELPDEAVPDYIARLHEQRDAVRDVADERGWLFIDLLEPFVEAVAQERLLYYRYDGHWNQEGHDLAAQIIADFIRAQGDSCAAEGSS